MTFQNCYTSFHQPIGEWNLRQFWNITSSIYAKYHVQIMLLFAYYTTTHKRFVIFTCRYFKLSWNTTALSQSNCRNFSCSSIKREEAGTNELTVSFIILSAEWRWRILPTKRASKQADRASSKEFHRHCSLTTFITRTLLLLRSLYCWLCGVSCQTGLSCWCL